MSTTDFTPDRSAAIRQLLIDTVADEPRRLKHLQILLTSVLSAIAIALAGGTAALALTGVIHFGGDDTPPAPAPTPTQTVTPTPTPTATSTPTQPQRPIAVQSSLIAPRDVTSLPAKPSWALDLPASGDPCEQYSTINIADGLALFQMGAVQVGDASDCDAENQNVSLTLVDTAAGKAVWSRQWAWTVPHDQAYGGTRVTTTVLGTSGRLLVDNPEHSGGPHEVIALADGTTLGSFDPGDQRYYLPVAVPGDSGDVIMMLPTAQPQIARVNPLDFGNPRWTTAVDGTNASLVPLGVNGLVRMTYSVATGFTSALVSVDDGRLIPGAFQGAEVADGVALQIASQPDARVVMTAVDPADGSTLWSRSKAEDSSVGVVDEASAQPGAPVTLRAPTGYLVEFSAASIQLIDARTGADVWSVDATSCAADLRPSYVITGMDPAHDSITFTNGTDLCRLDAHSGAVLTGVDFAPQKTGGPVFGSDVLYPHTNWDKAGTGTAYDLATGAELWSTPTKAGEHWFFAGGILVRQIGGHIESIG